MMPARTKKRIRKDRPAPGILTESPITGPDRNHAAGTLPELFERLRYRLAGQYPLPRHVRRNQRLAVDGDAGRRGVSPAPDTAADSLQFRQDWQLRPDRHARGPAEHPGRQPMALGRLAADDHSWPAANYDGPFHGPVVAGHTLSRKGGDSGLHVVIAADQTLYSAQ